ncbi:MAG: LuxR family transcriptional regulator, quorum-sensing system regulator LasR [Paraburkholderia sp.]|nr:LuxR family transcriptional regulator, quorum-sensing system regulator LasR [Paraburkholderia sp.]
MLRKFMESPLWDASDADNWFMVLAEMGRAHNFEYTTFLLSTSGGFSFGESFCKSNQSSVWRKIYEQKRHELIDPIVRHCRSKLSPLVWGEEDFSIRDEERALYEQGRAFGSHWGVALPIYGPSGDAGMLSFASSKRFDAENGDIARRLPELALIRDIAYETGLRYARQKATAAIPKLTPCEKEVLRWMVLGKTNLEISMIVRKTKTTINFHSANILSKLDANSRTVAVVKALKMRLVDDWHANVGRPQW